MTVVWNLAPHNLERRLRVCRIKCCGEYLDENSGADGIIVKLLFKGLIIWTLHQILRQAMEDEIGIGLLCGTNEE
jgi:hypothetical protein